MGRFRLSSTQFFATLLVVCLMAGCSTGNVPSNVPGDTTSPYVLSTSPLLGALGVALNGSISATFSEAITTSTLSTSTFTVTSAAGPLTGALAVSGNTATFTPSGPLVQDVTYTATITTGVKDLAGNAMVQNYVWQFVAVEVPSIVSTSPTNGATGVATSQAITATFVQNPQSATAALNCTTLTTATFVVTAVAGPVSGVVTCAGSIATFTPQGPLAQNTIYTATITTGAKNVAGSGLPTPLVWAFTTGSGPLLPPTVISTSPVNNAAGVPINQKIGVTFSAALNPATINSTTFTLAAPGGVLVAGAVSYAGTGLVAIFTPTSVLAPSTTYIATLTTGVQSLTVPTLALTSNYVWSFTTAAASATTPPSVISTSPANNTVGVPTNRSIAATFSVGLNPATINSTTFTVAAPGGALVAGAVSYASTGLVAIFTPTSVLAPNTTYIATITTGVQNLTVPALSVAANYVWFFTTAAGPSITPPAVISTSPANNAVGVPTNQKIAAAFSRPLNSASINSTTFTLTAPGGTSIAGAVSYVGPGSIAIFTPTSVLTPNTTYIATITTGVQNLTVPPLAMATNYIWSFTTAAGPVTTPPTVISTIPLNGSTGVPTNQIVTATFSKPMDPTTINSTTFTLTAPGGSAVVAGTVTYSAIGNTATFSPAANFASGSYAATITGATDLTGNVLASNFVWTFTVGSTFDTIQPTVVSTNAASSAVGVAINQPVSATFSKAINPLTITTETFQLVGPGGAQVPGTVSYDAINFIATFTATANLVINSVYTAAITNGVTDLAGNPLGSGGVPNPWIFTTGTTVVPLSVPLGTAALFGGFSGGAGMTNQGILTVINGNIGTTGVSTVITGFHDSGPSCIYTQTSLNIGQVNGAIDTAAPPPTVACPTEGTAVTSAIAAQAALDASTAYGALVAYPGGQDVSICSGCGGGSAGELGSRTLVPGIYKSAPGTYGITLGDLTLDAQGNPNAFWVFQMASTLTVGTPATPRNVVLVNGAQAKNVFWQVGTAATINGILGGGTMTGTIIAQSGISVSTAGVATITTLNGRAVVLTGPVTIVNTVINVPSP